MDQQLLAWTPPAKFPWSSVDRSLAFFEKLCSIRIESDAFGVPSLEETRRDATRLAGVLQLLEEYTPVKLATLWKLKENANVCSAIVRTHAYDQILDPNNPDHHTEFVCPIKDTHLELLLADYRTKKEEFWSQMDLFIFQM